MPLTSIRGCLILWGGERNEGKGKKKGWKGREGNESRNTPPSIPAYPPDDDYGPHFTRTW